MINRSFYQTQIVAENLHIPWAVDISEDGRLFFTERSGNLRVIENGILNPVPVYTFGPPFVSTGEGGLMGLALDRDFLSNGYIYIMYTYEENGRLYNRVVRMQIEGNTASEEDILLDRIPAGRFHNGGRIKIGPDGYLYITAGDAGNRYLAQDINSLAGKILRIGTDGSIPPDNPFLGSPVYALGLRNPQGMAWNDTWAPAGMDFVTRGPRMGQLLVSTLRGNALMAITFDESGTQAVNVERLLQRRYGRLREAYRARDGSIYLTTSNMDGRGILNPGDDKILKMVFHI